MSRSRRAADSARQVAVGSVHLRDGPTGSVTRWLSAVARNMRGAFARAQTTRFYGGLSPGKRGYAGCPRGGSRQDERATTAWRLGAQTTFAAETAGPDERRPAAAIDRWCAKV